MEAKTTSTSNNNRLAIPYTCGHGWHGAHVLTAQPAKALRYLKLDR